MKIRIHTPLGTYFLWVKSYVLLLVLVLFACNEMGSAKHNAMRKMQNYYSLPQGFCQEKRQEGEKKLCRKNVFVPSKQMVYWQPKNSSYY